MTRKKIKDSATTDHFSAIAGLYSRARIGYPPEMIRYLAGLCRSRELAWDCATGSGQALPELAALFKNVVATDISGELLAQAKRFPNVTYAKAAAEHSPLEDGSVDLITVAQALHWFDLEKFWTEVGRVLKPDGIFAFWGYTWPVVSTPVDAQLDQLRAILAPYWPERSAGLLAEYRTIVPPFEAIDPPRFNITVVWSRADYIAHLASWSAVRYCTETEGRNPLTAFEERLQTVWPETESVAVRWNLHLRVFKR